MAIEYINFQNAPEIVPPDRSVLELLCRRIESAMGLSFPSERWGSLVRALSKTAEAEKFRDLHEFCSWLLEPLYSNDRIFTLVSSLTIGETHFFRDEKLFHAFENVILPTLTSIPYKKIRIWSAGCATGEEPYTIAMLIDRLVPPALRSNIDILATDINRGFIAKALRGVYSDWSFRGAPDHIKKSYFLKNKHELELLPLIKKLVRFDHLNLVADPFPFSTDGYPADVIFCRNVLMYFSPSFQESVIDNFFKGLAPGGWLIVSPAEAAIVNRPGIKPSELGSGIFRKTEEYSPRIITPFIWPVVAQTQVEVTDFPPVDAASLLDEFEVDFPETPVKPQGEDISKGPFDIGRELFHEGRYLEASEKFRLCLDFERTEEEELVFLSWVIRSLANAGDLAGALHWTGKGLIADKLNPEFHYLNGLILQEKGEIEEAVKSLRKAVFLDPDLVVAHFALGNLAAQLGKRKDAEREFSLIMKMLDQYEESDVLPASEGLTAGRLLSLVNSNPNPDEGQTD